VTRKIDSSSWRPGLEKLEDWLQFYKDIGLAPFFRDRANSQSASPLGNGVAGSTTGVPEEENVSRAKLNISPTVPREGRGIAAAGTLELQGVAQGPSLFEVVDRIEGDTLDRTGSDLGDCTRCKLHRHRNKIVFGAGNPRAELMFVGEGPGHDEDIQGLPFVGRAGQLLTQMIEAMGLSRGDVYIANVVKCRPPENRTPEKDEVAACMPFLLRQISAIHPKAIVCLGSVAAQSLLNTNKSISRFRGEWFDFRGSRLMATYHPAYLLRNPHAKPDVWSDLKKVMKYLGLKPPVRGSSRA
jgi:uracil-DNA glycosylase family 4